MSEQLNLHLALQDKARVLLLGDDASAMASRLHAQRADLDLHCMADASPLASLHKSERFNVAIMSDIQAWDDWALAEQSVACMRDRLCDTLWVGASREGHFSRMHYLALGLRGATEPFEQTSVRDWYSYSIIHYKRIPDWLNADNWANPERWNRERW